MSRTSTAGATTTTKPTQSAAMPQTTMASVPQDKVAKRAYEKWMKSGCKHGCDMQNWLEAEAELRAEMNKSGMAKK